MNFQPAQKKPPHESVPAFFSKALIAEMKMDSPDLPGWTFEVEEVSNAFYSVRASDDAGRSVVRTGTELELDTLLDECRRAAIDISNSNLPNVSESENEQVPIKMPPGILP